MMIPESMSSKRPVLRITATLPFLLGQFCNNSTSETGFRFILQALGAAHRQLFQCFLNLVEATRSSCLQPWCFCLRKGISTKVLKEETGLCPLLLMLTYEDIF